MEGQVQTEIPDRTVRLARVPAPPAPKMPQVIMPTMNVSFDGQVHWGIIYENNAVMSSCGASSMDWSAGPFDPDAVDCAACQNEWLVRAVEPGIVERSKEERDG